MNVWLLLAGVVLLFIPCEERDSADAAAFIGIILIVLAWLVH